MQTPMRSCRGPPITYARSTNADQMQTKTDGQRLEVVTFGGTMWLLEGFGGFAVRGLGLRGFRFESVKFRVSGFVFRVWM